MKEWEGNKAAHTRTQIRLQKWIFLVACCGATILTSKRLFLTGELCQHAGWPKTSFTCEMCNLSYSIQDNQQAEYDT